MIGWNYERSGSDVEQWHGIYFGSTGMHMHLCAPASHFVSLTATVVTDQHRREQD